MIKNGPAAGPAKRWVIPLSVPENFDPPKEFKQTKEGQTDPNSFQKLTSNEFSAKAWHVDNNTVYLQVWIRIYFIISLFHQGLLSLARDASSCGAV